jgi:hypothetical protein
MKFSLLAVDMLAENRLIPKSMLKRRGATRIRFLRKMNIAPDGIGAEIGVQKGFFSHVLLHEFRPQRLHLLDPWYLIGEEWSWATTSKSTSKALRNVIFWFQKELTSKEIVLHIGFDEEVLAELPDNYFDWVYLDTSHTYEHTKRELELLHTKMKPSGMILGDDWFSDPSHKFFGQYRATKEFVEEKGYIVVYSSDTDHQWAIRRALTAK